MVEALQGPSKSLDDLIAEKLGTRGFPRASAVGLTIGTTVAAVIPNNPNRIGLVFVNVSVNTIYLVPVGTPSASFGIQLGPSGGTMVLLWEEDFHLTGWEWLAVASAVSSGYFYVEIVTG